MAGLTLGPDGRTPSLAATARGLFRYGEGRWARVEALGQQELVSVAEDGSRLAAVGARGGVLASDDGGVTWAAVTRGLQGRHGTGVREVLCLASSPAEPDHLYLGAVAQGSFESTDGGRSWTLLLKGLEAEPAEAFHPTAFLPGAGARPLLMGTAGKGLYAWEGRWSAVGKGLPERLRVQGLAADPGDPAHLALATRGHGLWESRDGGQEWTQLRTGPLGVVDAVSIGEGGAVLAGFAEEGLVCFRGETGSAPRPLGFARALTLVPRKGGGWLVGLTDDGVREVSPEGVPGDYLNLGLDATRVLSLAPGPEEGEGSLWCGDSNGAFHSADRGASWSQRDQGLPGAPVSVLTWAGGELYAGTVGQGVYRWSAEKKAWEERSGGLGTANSISSLAADAQGRLFVGTEGGILRSDDKGGAWARKNKGLPQQGYWRVAASRRTPGRVWAAGAGALYRSDDGAESWEKIGPAEPVALAVEAGEEGERLWLLEPGRLTAQGGEEPPSSWKAAGQERLNSLALGADRLWIGTTAGLSALAQGALSQAWKGPSVLAVLPAKDGKAFVGTDGAGVREASAD